MRRYLATEHTLHEAEEVASGLFITSFPSCQGALINAHSFRHLFLGQPFKLAIADQSPCQRFRWGQWIVAEEVNDGFQVAPVRS